MASKTGGYELGERRDVVDLASLPKGDADPERTVGPEGDDTQRRRSVHGSVEGGRRCRKRH